MAAINLRYVQGSENQERRISFTPFSPGSSYTRTKPPWISVDVIGSTKQIIVTLNRSLLNIMSPGVYTGNIVVTEIISSGSDGDVNESILLGIWSVELILTARIATVVTPNNLEYYYRIGNAEFPSDQVLTITSVESYQLTKNQSWLTISSNEGMGDQTINVGVNIQGLIPGTYNGVILVSDPFDTFQTSVQLIVDGELGTEDFLFITPDILRYEFTRFGFIPNAQNVSVNASGTFTVESASEWLSPNIIQGNQNTLSFDVSLNSLINNLGVGVFVSEVIVRLGQIAKIVNIEVDISQFIEELFDPETLYFTDDENVIRLASSDTNTNLSVLIDVAFQQTLNRFKYSIPFFKGESKTYIGEETRKIIGALDATLLLNPVSAVYVPYSPAVLNFQISENLIYTDTIVRGTSLSNIRFIKGVTPPDVKLTLLPNKVYMTSNAVLCFSFLSSGTPKSIFISGDISQIIPVTVNNNEFYSVMQPLRDLGLSIGDSITVNVDGISTNIQIKPDGIDHCMVFWENIWGCWDSFECTGKIKITERHKYIKEEYRKNRNVVEQKTLDVDTIESISIDTGWIYSDEEVTYLSTVFKSKNIYLLINGRLVQVNNKTSSFVPSETRRFKKSFKLTFENVIQ